MQGFGFAAPTTSPFGDYFSTGQAQRAQTGHSLIERVTNIGQDQKVVAKARELGKVVQFVSWEDTARTKGSAFGPNISDFTLGAKMNRLDQYDKDFCAVMPVMRNSNFADLSMDLDYYRFPLLVGNETGKTLTPLDLKTYLEHLPSYTDASSDTGSLWLARDEKILTSTQACFLPIKDGKVAFTGKLYNYQYDEKDPAVLVILASAAGTSAQVITKYNQELFFNKNGLAAEFLAERLSQFRAAEAKQTGQEMRTGAITDDEKEKNVILMFQVPLKQVKPKAQTFGFGGMVQCMSMSSNAESCAFYSNSSDEDEDMGMEDAIVSIGNTHGPFEGIGDRKLIRDERFPIRCTIQYYKVTDTSDLANDVIESVAQQLNKTYDVTPANQKGSLVLNPTVYDQPPNGVPIQPRITEPTLPTPAKTVYGGFSIGAL